MVSKSSRVLDQISLDGKVAIVTGGASGIGFASAELLAEVGATVVILDINESEGNKAVEEIKKSGGKAKFLLCDVSSDSECKKT